MKEDTKLATEATVMAIRESLMEYFKGSCVERVITNSNVRLSSVSNGTHGTFMYQRHYAAKENRCVLFIGSTPILTVRHLPDTVILHRSVLNRSREMREISGQIEEFLDEYLSAIEREESNGPVCI